MKKNIGDTDRLLRATVGIIIMIVGIVTGSWWGLLCLLPLGTALVGYCPPYALLGIDTAKPRTARA